MYCHSVQDKSGLHLAAMKLVATVEMARILTGPLVLQLVCMAVKLAWVAEAAARGAWTGQGTVFTSGPT
jgi:hypothetical protein